MHCSAPDDPLRKQSAALAAVHFPAPMSPPVPSRCHSCPGFLRLASGRSRRSCNEKGECLANPAKSGLEIPPFSFLPCFLSRLKLQNVFPWRKTHSRIQHSATAAFQAQPQRTRYRTAICSYFSRFSIAFPVSRRGGRGPIN